MATTFDLILIFYYSCHHVEEKEAFLALVIMCSSLFRSVTRFLLSVFGHYHIHLGIVMNIEYISQFIISW